MQSPWSIKNPNGDNPNEEEILKPVCFVFDFAPTRALRQIAEYGIGLSPEANNPEDAVKDLVTFLPVLAYDGSHMTQVDAGGILDIAMAGTSATLLARKWEICAAGQRRQRHPEADYRTTRRRSKRS